MSQAVTVSELSLRGRIAEEIQVLLVRRRMSTAELARRIGMKQPYMSRRMTGEVAWDVDDLERIAAVLNVEVADLLPRRARSGQPNDRKASPADRPVTPKPPGHPQHNVRPSSSQRPARIAGALAHV